MEEENRALYNSFLIKMLRGTVVIVWVAGVWAAGAVSVDAARDYLSPADDPAREVSRDYRVDLDGDGQEDLLRVTYGPGVSNRPLKIEVLKDGQIISTLTDRFGIQSNYKIVDTDGDGRKEIIIWSGLWDPRLPGEDGVTEDTYEGHSSPHRYIVATYKMIRGEYALWDIYTTPKKYFPYVEDQPMR